MNNKTIRIHAKHSGIKLWEIAYELGITDSHFSRKLRFELPEKECIQILDLINEIQRRKQGESA